MRLRLTVIAVLCLCSTALVPLSATAQQPPDPVTCAARLNCDLDQINQLTMPQRLTMVRAMEAGPVAAMLPAGTDPGRWRNIEGILLMFVHHRLGAPGSWVSWTDAGILEGVERGIAVATGRSTETGGNPGVAKWASYLTRLAAGQLTARSAHDRAWSLAEQASTDHGTQVAETVHGTAPSPAEQRFFELSQVYRFLLQNRPPLLDVVTAVGSLAGRGKAGQRQNFYDWATDSTNADAGRTGAELLWSTAQEQLPGTAINTVTVFQAYFRGLLPAYAAATQTSVEKSAVSQRSGRMCSSTEPSSPMLATNCSPPSGPR